MRDSIKATGEKLERTVFDRLAARLSYVQGDFADAATYERLAAEIKGARAPLFYLETPPSLFATVVKGLADAGLTKNARVVIEKPFGHDLASAKALAAELHRSIDEEQIFRVDHFLGKLGLEELLYLRYANTILAPVWNSEHVSSIQLTLAEAFGVEDRGRFYDAVGALRDVVVNHLLQLLAAATMEAPLAGESLDERTPPAAAVGRGRRPDALRPRPVRRLPLDAGRQVALDDRDVRGARAAHRQRPLARRPSVHPHRQAPRDHAHRGAPRLPRRLSPHVPLAPKAAAAPTSSSSRVDPATGIRLILEAHRADAVGPEPITLDMEFAEQGGEGPTPYELIFEAALGGDRSLFIRQETVEEAWRIVQPLLDSNRRAHPYRKGTWGPTAADALLEGERELEPPGARRRVASSQQPPGGPNGPTPAAGSTTVPGSSQTGRGARHTTGHARR